MNMKKVFQIFMVFVMVLSLTACGSNSGGSTAESSSAADNAESNTGDNSVSVEDAGDETSAANDPITFTIFIDHSWFWFDSWGNDDISKEITKRTGVSFEIVRATDDQQLALLIAAGDLPDFIYTSTKQTMTLLEDSNVCYSYNELIDRTGVDIHASDTEIRNNKAEDGNFYALRNANVSQEVVDAGQNYDAGKSIAYRTDIYEAIGSPELKTLEDLENALVAAKELYPEVIPLLNNGNLWYFAEQLGIAGTSSVGYNSDGEVCYGLNIDGIEEYFALLNRFARKGLIDAEAQTYNFDRFSEVRNSGRSFMQLRSCDEAAVSNLSAAEAGTGYTWKLLTNELSDNAVVSANTGIGWSGTYISKNCSDPERAIEFMSWCRSEEGRKLCSWGIQGDHWDYNEQGQTVYTESYQAGIAEGKRMQDDFGIGVWIFGDQGDEKAFIDYAVTDPQSADIIAKRQSGAQHSTIMSELYFAIPTSGDELTIYNALEDIYSSEFLKVIFAETDEEYEAALSNWYKQADQLGIDKLEAWMRNAVAEYWK